MDSLLSSGPDCGSALRDGDQNRYANCLSRSTTLVPSGSPTTLMPAFCRNETATLPLPSPAAAVWGMILTSSQPRQDSTLADPDPSPAPVTTNSPLSPVGTHSARISLPSMVARVMTSAVE